MREEPTGRSYTASAPVDFVALSAGRTIGCYEVVAVLGQGGYGITYRALDRQLGREVAIKEYLPLAFRRLARGHCRPRHGATCHLDECDL